MLQARAFRSSAVTSIRGYAISYSAISARVTLFSLPSFSGMKISSSESGDGDGDGDGDLMEGFLTVSETVSETPAETRISSLKETESGTFLAAFAMAFQMLGLAGRFHSRNFTTHTHLVSGSYFTKPASERACKLFRNRFFSHSRSSHT